jgi:hypothetical protein
MNKFVKFYIKRNENFFLSFCFVAWSQNYKKKKGSGHSSKPVTRLATDARMRSHMHATVTS